MNIRDKITVGYGLLQAIVLRRSRPLLVSWQITERCNLRCKYCHSSGDKSLEIDSDRARDVIRSLYGMGTRVVRFTGGEPLLREDLPKLVHCCHEVGIISGIASNGLLFPDMADDLKRVGAVSFSLDGPEDVHDSVRGPGAYKGVIRAIEAAKARNMDAAIFVTLGQFNLGCVDDILRLAEAFRIRAFFQPVTRRRLGPDQAVQILPEEAHFRAVMQKLAEDKKNNKFIGNSCAALKHLSRWPQKTAMPCVAGRVICRIGADGQMVACPQAPGAGKPLNVLKKSVRDCFEALVPPFCGECWCGLFVELNLLSRLNPAVIVNAFK